MGADDPLVDAEHITHTHELLVHAAQRAQDQPASVAWALARVQVREGLSDEALAARLGVATVDLPRLALCLRPRAEHWTEDLAQIAGTFGLAPETLAAVLRAGEAPAERLQDLTDLYDCPTHGARCFSRGEVRPAERDEVCLYVCTLCGQVAQ